MKEKVGEVFSIAKDNSPVTGCTISKEVHGGENSVIYFSLAQNTDISAEIFPYHKLLIVADGSLEVYGPNGYRKSLDIGDCVLTLTDVPVGMITDTGAVYTEIEIRRKDIMNEAIKAGEIFKLAELVPYAEVVMAFDEGTGLSEHAAPGEALIFALDGEGVIGYEGTDHPIKAGENFHFAKAGLHSVKATKRFKMALLLTLE